jgi:hypothetical protein
VSISHFSKALVVGTVRNAQKNVIPDIQRIMSALEDIYPTLGFVVESDSSDETIENLSKHAETEERFSFISLGKIEPEIPDRIDRLRYCRNEYVKVIRSDARYRDCDLIVVADLDGINTKIKASSFITALKTEISWDVLTANQAAPYYDILALRHPMWSPNSWLLEYNWLKPIIGESKALRHALSDRMIKIPTSTPPIEVDSAFGGLGLYKRWIFEEFDYSKDIQESNFEIDHVTLHRKAKNSGARIFIHPELVNASWTSHSRNGARDVLLLRRIFKKFNYFGLRSVKKRFFSNYL